MHQVLSVRGGGTLGVVVRGVGRDHTFRMEDRGTISSLKFSPDHSVLSVQRSKNSVVSNIDVRGDILLITPNYFEQQAT